MLTLKRDAANPLLSPLPEHDWESEAAFNPCVIFHEGRYHMLYRALSSKQNYFGVTMHVSTIGHAVSTDGIHFAERKQLITPEHDWEFYGCEDPRVTKVDDTFYIFYTALSTYPFSADGIKVGVALTKDFITISEKHLVTPFNAKAMCLFPQKIQNKLVALLTADTDRPPAKIGLAYFDRIEEMWDRAYWENWYAYLPDHTLHLQKNERDHVEIGAPPIKTEAGWLLLYSYIKNYFSDQKDFTIEAITLQMNNPLKIERRTDEPLLTPSEDYEKNGIVKNIVFPTGALATDDTLSVYYGGADTVSCLATCSISALLREMHSERQQDHLSLDHEIGTIMFHRFDENPVLRATPDHPWEAKAVLNPAAILEGNKIHLLYRAISNDNVSTIGYALSEDGYHITKRLTEPVYTPQASFETNTDGKNYGCEDPRVTKIDERYYMCYTAYDGHNPPRVALTSISTQDLLANNWNWSKPQLISPPGIDDKDACLFPEKINNHYVFLHRMNESIWIDTVDDLNFNEGKVLTGMSIVESRPDKWDSKKIGIASPPILTKDGWLLLYHGIDKDNRYNVGAMLLERDHPGKVLARLDYPIFTPETEYEKIGNVPHVVFPCGALILNGHVVIYYGGADTVVGVANIDLTQLLDELARYRA